MNGMYNQGKTQVLDGRIDLDDDDIELLLIQSGSGYSFNPDQDFVSEISTYEASGTGYSRQDVTNVTITEDDTNDYAVMDGDDVVWSDIDAGTFSAAVMYKNSGSGDDSVSPLIMYTDNDFPATTSGGDIKVIWSDSGIIAL